MDARNLAIVLTPNLVASGNPLKDVEICSVKDSPGSMFGVSSIGGEQASREGRTTLGTIIKLCIHRYFEVFDEMADRAEAMERDPFSVGGLSDSGQAPSTNSSVPSSPLGVASSATSVDGVAKRHSLLRDDDSLDDTMLVMPIGPSGSSSRISPTTHNFSESGTTSSTTRVWPPGAKGTVRSVVSGESRVPAHGTLTKTRARSLFAPASENGGPVPAFNSRKNGLPTSVSANGTLRKAAGSAVSAHSVTASGFFAQQPGDAPAVPPLPPPVHPSLALRRST
jgi:Rho GTPase-activating protein 1